MPNTFDQLSDTQKANFYGHIERIGIDPKAVATHIVTGDTPDGLKVGHPTLHSDIEPAHVKKIDSVAQLKSLCGVSDTDYTHRKCSDQFVKYPKSLAQTQVPSLSSCNHDVCELKNRMTTDCHKQVGKALHSYLVGNSSKVSDYEDHINAIHFPMQMTSYAAQNLTITKDSPLIVDHPDSQPVQLVFGTVTIEPGGYILVKTPLNLNAQVFEVQN